MILVQVFFISVAEDPAVFQVCIMPQWRTHIVLEPFLIKGIQHALIAATSSPLLSSRSVTSLKVTVMIRLWESIKLDVACFRPSRPVLWCFYSRLEKLPCTSICFLFFFFFLMMQSSNIPNVGSATLMLLIHLWKSPSFTLEST